MPDIDPWALRLPNLRSCFLPDQGFALVEGDLARADAQVIAWEAEARELKRQLSADEDIHSDNADMLYGHIWRNKRLVRVREIDPRSMHTSGKTFRDGAKSWVHCTNFAGGSRTVSQQHSILETHCKDCQQWWTNERHPEIGRLHRRVDFDLKSRKNPVIFNRFGFRRLYVGGDRQSNLLGQALAWIAQCLPLDHEVLTREGWKEIGIVSSEEEIAIWHKSGEITFEVPSRWNKGYTDELLYLDGVHCSVTPNHRIPYYNAGRDDLQTTTAARLPRGARIPRTGLYSGSNIWSDLYARYVTAFQADGHYDPKRDAVIFEFKRERKIQRIELILSALRIPYTKTQVRRDATVFYIPKGEHRLDPMFKTFGPWLLGLSAETLDTILHELQFWDGSVDPNGVLFYQQAIESSVEWLATIAHLRGKRARWYNEDLARITIAPNKGLRSTTRKGRISGRIEVACPTVSTGYFMVRHAKEISVTGNSTVAIVINTALRQIDPDALNDILALDDFPSWGRRGLALPELDYLLQIHDSILGQVLLRDLTDDFIRRFDDALAVTVPYDDPLIIAREIKWSTHSWGDMQKWKMNETRVAA